MPIEFGVGEVALAAASAALLTIVMQWLLHPVAHKLDLLDHPKGRKHHSHPTPVTGGLAMAIPAILILLATAGPIAAPLRGFICGSTLLVVVGLLDDKYDVRWWIRILVQVAAALAMVYIGGVQVERLGPVFGLGETSLGMLSVPFTVFATVGLINAVNMIDGADGLAGSLVFAALLMLVAAALYSGNEAIALRIAILGGAVAGFLAYNLRTPWRARAKVFMGNAGSAFLGYVIAYAMFRLTQDTVHDVSPVLALWILPIPVMDTLVLMVRRLRLRQSPFHADRNHIHHLMMLGGFGPTQAALALSVFSGCTGLVAAQSLRWNVPEPLLLAAFVALCVLWYWMTSQRDRAIGFFRWVHPAPLAETSGVAASAER